MKPWFPALVLSLVLLLHPRVAPAGTSAPPAAWRDDLAPLQAADWNVDRAAHLLARAGFGGPPAEVARLAQMDAAAAVDFLVDYEKIPDSDLPAFEPSGIYPHGWKFGQFEGAGRELFRTGKIFGVPAAREGALPLQPAINEFYTLLVSEHAEMRRAGEWWADRMLRTPRPLQEHLTLFWHNHFATSQEKVMDYELMLRQNQTFRDLGNGNFRTLLLAVAQDPAMLIWLDNRDNRRGHPNENFAREILELFCLGEGRGYTESDIRELARAFTGWGLAPRPRTNDPIRFVAAAAEHDDGEKRAFGVTGRLDGTNAIDLILAQPGTPLFITRKLYRWFVREDLSPALNRQLADLLVQSHYELKPVLRALFLSRDFYSAPSLGTQITAPVPWLVGTCRKLGLRQLPGTPNFTETAGALGQVLFYPPNVAGWPGRQTWINPATLTARARFAHELLYPATVPDVARDKIIAEGFRRLPDVFPQHGLTPRIWDDHTGRMEPVSSERYHQFLAELESDTPTTTVATIKVDPADPKMNMALKPYGAAGMSKAAQMAETEFYNLGVGVYTGFIEAYNRVKPIPRTPAPVDVLTVTQATGLGTPEAIVDGLGRNFLLTELAPTRRAALVAFLQGELAGQGPNPSDPRLPDALRRTLELVLSAPEYQLH